MTKSPIMRGRPHSPNIQIYRPQLTSVLSIINRITGVVLSLCAIVLVIWLIAAASGPQAYSAVQAVIGSWIGVEHVMKRVQQTAISSDVKRVEGLREESVEERTDQGISSLASVKSFPLIGAGGGAFEAMYPEYKQPGYMLSLDHAHNDYVEFLVESGPVGMIVLAALLSILALRCTLTLLRSNRAACRGLSLGGLIGLAATAIHATVEFALQVPAVAVAVTALIAICCLASDTRSGGEIGVAARDKLDAG